VTQVRDQGAAIVEPSIGLVLGCRLGESLEGVTRRWPGGELTRRALGRVDYSLTQQVGQERVCVRSVYQFLDDALVAVELRPAARGVSGIERHVHRQLADELLAAHPGSDPLRDEGYVSYEVGQVRISVDAFDATIRIEEAS